MRLGSLPPEVVWSPVIVGAGVAALAVLRHRFRVLWFAVSFFFVTIFLPAVMMDATYAVYHAADRYLYIPLFGFCYVVSYGCVRAYQKMSRLSRIAGATAMILLCCLLIIVTRQRIALWESSLFLRQDAVQKYPASPTAYANLGSVYADSGERGRAMYYFSMALSIDPRQFHAGNNLAILLAEEKEGVRDALALLEKAHAADPGRVPVLVSFCRLYLDQGRHSEAFLAGSKALAIDPFQASGYCCLGTLFDRTNRREAARLYYAKAITLDPDLPLAYNNLGASYLQEGLYPEAAACLGRALALDPRYAQAYNNLGVVYAAQGNYSGAIVYFHRALEIRPSYAGACGNLARAYLQTGQIAEAMASYQEAKSRGYENPSFERKLEAVLADEGGQA